jgi:hypothetical protein
MSNSPRRIVRLAGLCITAIVMSSFAPVPVQAKLRADERPLLVEILTGSFGEAPLRSTTTCVANRLSPGTMDEVIDDASFVASETELADSIAFRRMFKAIFACRPPQLQRVLVSGMSGSSLTFKQKSCLARGLMTRIGIDEEMLTLMIRGGLNDTDFAALDPEQDEIFRRNALIAIRPCVPARDYVDAIEDWLNS